MLDDGERPAPPPLVKKFADSPLSFCCCSSSAFCIAFAVAASEVDGVAGAVAESGIFGFKKFPTALPTLLATDPI